MKNKNFKRFLGLMLSSCILASVFTGCGKETENVVDESKTTEISAEGSKDASESTGSLQSEKGEFDPRSITEGVTLTIAAPADPRIADYEDNDVTRIFEEKFGVNLEFKVFAADDYREKINLMVNSGEELPDIIFYPGDYVTSWASEGALLDLREYYDDPNYSANIREQSEAGEIDIIMYMTDPEGHIYGFPALEQSGNTQTARRFWCYEPWLDALGVDYPETAEEFYEVCKLVAATDLNGNGKHDEIPVWGQGFTGSYYGWFGGLMSPFIYAFDSAYRVVEDGKVSFAFTTDEWKEGLKYIKKFVDEGLLPTEVLTQNKEAFEMKWYGEEMTVFSFWYYCYNGTDVQRRYDYSYGTGLKNENGENGYSYFKESVPSNYAVISADCENPDAAFLICDYMCSEYISLSNRYGKQGVHWDYWENVKDTIENPENYTCNAGGEPYFIYNLNEGEGFWESSEPQSYSWRQNGPYLRMNNLSDGAAKQVKGTTPEEQLTIDAAAENQASIAANLANRPEELYDYGPLTADENDAFGEIETTLISYVRQMVANFITGVHDIDGYWDTYLAELEKIGVDSLLETYQTAYDRVH